jgi:outer membrane receptor protein involved in Fe transport
MKPRQSPPFRYSTRHGHPIPGSLCSGSLCGLLAIASLGWTVSVAAEARAVDPHDDVDGSDPPLVLTPARLPQRLDEAPSTVTVIDREMIEASGARRLVDVLRLVPGFQVGYKINSLPTATIPFKVIQYIVK